MSQKRSALWPLKRLRACRKAGSNRLIGQSAAWVYLALLQLADADGPVVCTTRDELAGLTGISRLPTISDALTALHKAQWIERILVAKERDGHPISLLKIVVKRFPNDAHMRYEIRKPKSVTNIVTLERNEKRNTTLSRERGGVATRRIPTGIGAAPPQDGKEESVAMVGNGDPKDPNVATDPNSGVPLVVLDAQREAASISGSQNRARP